MAGRNYERGRAFEYRVKRKLERDGFFVVRSAGSHFPDLLAVKEGVPYAVECKRDAGRVTRMELERLAALRKHGIIPLVAYPRGGRIELAPAETLLAARVGKRGRREA